MFYSFAEVGIHINRRIKFYFIFWKSTQVITLSIACIILVIWNFSGIELEHPTGFITSLFCGLLLSLFYKELISREEYFFYYNQGISRLELWIFSVFIYFLIGTLLKLVANYVPMP